jgi:hypothetical protein
MGAQVCPSPAVDELPFDLYQGMVGLGVPSPAMRAATRNCAGVGERCVPWQSHVGSEVRLLGR